MGITKKRKYYVPYLFEKRHYVYENQEGANRKPYMIMINEDKSDNGPDLFAAPVKKK
ncbi:hypothetical protein [Bacillus sp. Marseille-P3661]|uniref:hypothetical protein n=1 Tax=Bacillus sp. Marseille-P3661 TaxID=1936234 RepID=UPI0015E19DEE|nr:hypothetical protein [Bacillus sp. Marseille-P3661]